MRGSGSWGEVFILSIQINENIYLLHLKIGMGTTDQQFENSLI